MSGWHLKRKEKAKKHTKCKSEDSLLTEQVLRKWFTFFTIFMRWTYFLDWITTTLTVRSCWAGSTLPHAFCIWEISRVTWGRGRRAFQAVGTNRAFSTRWSGCTDGLIIRTVVSFVTGATWSSQASRVTICSTRTWLAVISRFSTYI